MSFGSQPTDNKNFELREGHMLELNVEWKRSSQMKLRGKIDLSPRQ